MANGPIGINFLPSQENQDQGMQRGAMEGDLGEALKILSLRVPRVLGARSITPGSNLGQPGVNPLAGMTGSVGGESGVYNPNSALFQALIRALLGGGDETGGLGKTGGVTGMGGGAVNPYIKFVDKTGTGGSGGDGGGLPQIPDENTAIYRKPETQWGGIGRTTELPPIPGDAATYGRIPRKYDPGMNFTEIP